MARKVTKKPRRIVLGVGHPFFEKHKKDRIGYQKVLLLKEYAFPGDVLTMNIMDLSAAKKIRLVAEIIE